MNRSQPKLILASRSPRRSELLKTLGLEFEVVPSAVEEILDPGLSPEQNALAVAREKARAVARQYTGCHVLGADTMVVLNGEIIGQPADPQDALRILQQLAGQQHRVITGVVLVDPEGREFESVVTSLVAIKTQPLQKLKAYIETGEPLDKAGAYAIQGEGSFLVESWDGSFSNIVGLPLESLRELCEQAGLPLPRT